VKIKENKILSKLECSEISLKLIKQRDNWEKRISKNNINFMTYGALTYLDIDNYSEKSNYFNKLLKKDFKLLYNKIKEYYEIKFNKPVVFEKALPGFHIFEAVENVKHDEIKNLGKIHIDKPHELHKWDYEIENVLSFTIALQLPNCTAGLNTWDGSNAVKYIPYKTGYIYEQDGKTLHQIAIGGDVFKNEKRITLQGHLVQTEKQIIIYV